MSRSNLAWLLGVPAIIVVGLTIAFAAPRTRKPKDQDYELVQLVVEVLAQVDRDYVRELSPDEKRKFIADMINGGLERLDPYSTFYDIEDYTQFLKQTEGAFGGVGIQIDVDRQQGYVKVTSPMVGTPAYEAGIQAGDVILKVDGKVLETARLSELLKMIQGPPGTEVTLTVLHEGSKNPVDYTMKRAKIEYPSIMGDRRKPDDPTQWDYFVDKENRIAYIRLVSFNEHAVADLKKAVEQVEKEGAKALILDLRDNPGGLLTQAADISDLFLTQGTIVNIKDRKGRGKTYEAKAEGTFLEPAASHPMAVLVNRNSASASEIVSAALQDHKRAVVIGERTFGKGSVQNVIELGDHEPKVALKLTTASYWRPNGTNIHRGSDAKDTDDWGVKPNPGMEVPLETVERVQYGKWRKDRDVVQGKPGTAAAKKPVDESVAADKYLSTAVNYLRGELKK
jgi:carboxyl-terminal processing protease